MQKKPNQPKAAQKKAKRSYKKPTIVEEEVFDRTVLQACSGCDCSTNGEPLCDE